jgi:hypothetical protein
LIQEAIERLTNTNADLLSRKGCSFEKEMDGVWMRSGEKAYGCGHSCAYYYDPAVLREIGTGYIRGNGMITRRMMNL